MNKYNKFDRWKNINFTDPHSYNADNFIFLVHTIDLPDNILSQIHVLNIGKIVGFKNFSKSQNINLNIEPWKISEKRLISCSLISSSNECQTYTPYGFILKCPIENILCISTSDMGIPYLLPDEVINKYKNIPLFEPSVLISSKSWNYNEVVVQGTTEFGKVEIAGIFVNNNNFSMESESFSQKVIQQAEKLSNLLNVPLIKLQKKKRVIEDKSIEVFEEDLIGVVIISFAKNGKKYSLFCGKDEIELQSSSDQIMHLMNKEDFIIFMNEISKLKAEDLIKYKNIIEELPIIFEKQNSKSNDDSLKK
jgi:hypothetical protein